jgi:ankyrin repeat protein
MAVSILDRGTAANAVLARQRMKTLKTMLKLGADPNIPAFDGTTPLRTALDTAYDINVFRLLLRYGVDPDVAGKDGRTVREVAARKRDRRYDAALAQ